MGCGFHQLRASRPNECRACALANWAVRTLGLAVVHAVLARERLDQRLQRAVARRVVAAANRALHLWRSQDLFRTPLFT